MKPLILVLGLVAVTASAAGAASNVGVDVNINVGTPPPLPPPPMVIPPPPVVITAPPPPSVVIQGPPMFVMPQSLGFYVAVGVPYDIFYVGGQYYLYQGNSWYRAPYYNGPWGAVPYKHLPPGLRKHTYDRIVYYRDQEYRVYRNEHDNYRGKHFKPGKEWKEQRKEEKKWEKEQKKEQKKHGKHDD
jgi:hypothetical protein